MQQFSEYAPVVTRLSVTGVILWFGINQLLFPENFMGYLPEMLLQLSYAKTLVIFNGIFEVLFGSLLLLGLFVRPVAFLLTLHLAAITAGLGYNDIAIRDIGLTGVTLAICIGGADKWTLDKKWRAL